MKKHRKLPDYAVHPSDFRSAPPFDRLGTVEIRSSIVSLSKYQSFPNNGPQYSDADLELLIARLKVAKEAVCEEIDQHIKLFTDILNSKE